MGVSSGQHSCLFPFSLSSTVSHSYGYGLLDAGAIVELAKTWTSVGPQRKCVITVVSEPRLVHTHTSYVHTPVSLNFLPEPGLFVCTPYICHLNSFELTSVQIDSTTVRVVILHYLHVVPFAAASVQH